MEFKFRDGENRSNTTLSPQQRPLSTVSSFSGHPLRGGFPGIIPAPRVYQPSLPIKAEEAFWRDMEREQIWREMEKEEIRREILAGEMARRRELEEEVRRELASERALRMPMHRMEGIMFRERVSMSMNQGMRLKNPINNINISDGPQPQLAPKADITQFYNHTQTQTPTKKLTSKNNVIILAKPDAALCGAKCKEVLDADLSGVKRKEVLDADLSGVKRNEVLDVDLSGVKRKEVIDVKLGGAKRKVVTLFPDDDKHSGSSLQKKAKKDWSCSLCQITTTSEKGLNDHLQGKKHKIKAASLTTQKIGLGSRRLQSGINPAGKAKLELRIEDLAVQKTHDLVDRDTENEATSEKEVRETNASTTKKKFKFYCAFCEVQTHSESVMESHKSGKKHLANIKKFSPNNDAAASKSE